MSLTERQREIIAEVEGDLTRWAQDNVIGHTADTPPSTTAAQLAARYAEAGMTDVQADARYLWACPHTEEGHACPTCGAQDLDIASDGHLGHATCCSCGATFTAADSLIDESCEYRILPPTWRHPIRRLRLKLTGSPGRCPLHRRRLHLIIDAVVSGTLPAPIRAIRTTMTVDDA